MMHKIKILNLVIKIITTIYLGFVIGLNLWDLIQVWEGICIYIIGFSLFQIANLFNKKQSLINVIYIVALWLILCIRYIYASYTYFNLEDVFVLVLQILPISATLLNYYTNRKEL